MNSADFHPGDCVVIKVGSSLLTQSGKGLDLSLVNDWVDQIASLVAAGKRIVIVSSGAVAEGMARLGFEQRPRSIHQLQAAAAVGQMGLIQAYESSFQRHGMHTAQVLLTHADLRSRERYLNARTTLMNLLALGVIPVINENDTVVTDEIRFGDNDTLAALVANLIGANLLLLLTDQLGLYDKNPRSAPDAELVIHRAAHDPELEQMAGAGGAIGRGGMVTKVRAAKIAARGGANTVITGGAEPRCIAAVFEKNFTGTLLTANEGEIVARKQWLATLEASGDLYLDDGAATVICKQGKSLLAVGVNRVEGDFTRGDMVRCVDPSGTEIARGLVNYSAVECEEIAGLASSAIERTLGYVGEDELIHRDNLVLS